MPRSLRSKKASPILYNLEPDASKADIEREKKRLVATLRDHDGSADMTEERTRQGLPTVGVQPRS
jgi:hypothetical protein